MTYLDSPCFFKIQTVFMLDMTHARFTKIIIFEHLVPLIYFKTYLTNFSKDQ